MAASEYGQYKENVSLDSDDEKCDEICLTCAVNASRRINLDETILGSCSNVESRHF